MSAPAGPRLLVGAVLFILALGCAGPAGNVRSEAATPWRAIASTNSCLRCLESASPLELSD